MPGRMQIEESFRDLKDPRQGAALRHALTRKAPRMEILILLYALIVSVKNGLGVAFECATFQLHHRTPG